MLINLVSFATKAFESKDFQRLKVLNYGKYFNKIKKTKTFYLFSLYKMITFSLLDDFLVML